MLTKHIYTVSNEDIGHLITDEITEYRIFGFFLIYKVRREIKNSPMPVNDTLRSKIFEIDNAECVFCGENFRPFLSIDHRFPQSRGGKTTEENLLTCCRSCNSKKKNRTPEEANMPLAYGRYRGANINISPIKQFKDYNPEKLAQCIIQLHRKGMGKVRIIRELWGIYPGKSKRYQDASNIYDEAIKYCNNNNMEG